MLANLQLLFQAPVFGVDLLVNGLLVGAIFALAAYGMALVWGVMGIINIAQGELVMLGGYVTLTVVSQFGLNPLFGVPIAAVVLYFVGIGLYYLVIRRVVDKDMFISILATFGLSIIISQLSNAVFGPDVRTADAHLPTLLFLSGDVSVAAIKLVAFCLSLATGFVLWLFFSKSKLGQAIRATAQNARAARILGVDADKVYAATFGINAALCGAVGALAAMAWTIHPYIGLPYTVRSFMIVIVAGLGNIPGVALAGLGLGAAENFAAFILGTEFQVAFVFSLMVAILVWRNFRLQRERKYLK